MECSKPNAINHPIEIYKSLQQKCPGFSGAVALLYSLVLYRLVYCLCKQYVRWTPECVKTRSDVEKI